MTVNQGQILAVDDTAANLKVISQTLRDAGYGVATAIDGERALKRLEHYQPDLILLDVQMPGIDGFETCRRLKRNPKKRHIPVIFITALSDTINKVKGLEIGGVDYITKPFDHDEFLARIKVHINLRRAQLQLIQESKLSTLGELVAGIAHEVNNPVNFIAGNLSHAEQYHQDLIQLLELYETELSEPSQIIRDWQEQIDLDFLKRDYLKLLKSMRLGARRITGVISSLRSFACLDEADWKLVDLNSSLENTLTLLSHRLHANSHRRAITVKKDYEEMPPYYCNPTQINQVFMHILINGIEAINEKYWSQTQKDKYLNEQPRLIISTRVNTVEKIQWFEIDIEDNGVGIIDTIRSQIFEQFFTTKETGKGTGLGLAIAHQIITEQHGGMITFTSKLGVGTTFKISLPGESDPVEPEKMLQTHD